MRYAKDAGAICRPTEAGVARWSAAADTQGEPDDRAIFDGIASDILFGVLGICVLGYIWRLPVRDIAFLQPRP